MWALHRTGEDNDPINHDTDFTWDFHSNVCHCNTSSLKIDNYNRKVIGNGAKSHTFTRLNGVCQGGILSPLLLNVYFDEIIYKLENSDIG